MLTYARFTKALVDTEEDRPTAYFVAHGVLIVVNLLIAVVLGTWGWKALRAARLRDAEDHPSSVGSEVGSSTSRDDRHLG